MTEWSPDIPRQTVRGTSARILASNGLVAACVVVTSCVLFLIGFLIGFLTGPAVPVQEYEGPQILNILLIPMVLSAFHGIVSSIRYDRRVKQEARMGYTTCYLQPAELDEVDWKTGRVIRLASEPRLSREEFRARVAAVRSAAASAPGAAGARGMRPSGAAYVVGRYRGDRPGRHPDERGGDG